MATTNTSKNANGTSFHDTVLLTSVKLLREKLGEPDFDENSGDDKINFEWLCETDRGDVFTIYDWKEYREISEHEEIEFHIGGMNRIITEEAKKELEYLLSK